MDFRVEEEIRVIQQVVKHFFGPCLMCDRETEYGNIIPRLGVDWLWKQFEPDARERNLKAVRHPPKTFVSHQNDMALPPRPPASAAHRTGPAASGPTCDRPEMVPS